ncbi:MAG: DUF2807 domain-containing protein, partial [Defluviitaleaceae bacterium]|nr:DUF2807 domain-containing protein [Defluviitaleaceae bacterium]
VVYTLRHFVAMCHIRRWSVPENSYFVLSVLESEKSDLNIRRKVRVLRCREISSPMLMGLFRPTILLPLRADYSPNELAFVLRHELIHHKLRDIWVKLLLLTIKSIYWFNPAVYLMAKQSEQDMEMICDGLTTNGMSFEDKKTYSHLILSFARSSSYPLTTSMASSSKKMLKQRFYNILVGAKRRGKLMFAAISAALLSGVVFVGFTFAPMFTLPMGYTQQIFARSQSAGITQISFDEDNLAQRTFEFSEQIQKIDVDFVSTIYVFPTGRDFVQITTDAALLDMMEVSLDDGVLTITPPDANVASNRDFREFTRIYVGVRRALSDVGVGLLNETLREHNTQHPHLREGDVSIRTHSENPVNVRINAIIANLSVDGVTDVNFFGNSVRLSLENHTTEGNVDLRDLPVWRADLALAGGNTVMVNARDLINVTSSSATANAVEYIGSPYIREQVVSGNLNLTRLLGLEE